MISLDPLFEQAPFSLEKQQKDALWKKELSSLVRHHRSACPEYDHMLSSLGFEERPDLPLEEYPYLPVSLFKEMTLSSVPEEQISKRITSSGTTGQKVSQIILDAETSALQQKALISIMSDLLGKDRLPMLVLDCPSVLKDRTKFTARGAGVLGFSLFGKTRVFALDDEMKLDLSAIRSFLGQYGDKPFFLFGFTFMVWKYFYGALRELPESLDFSNGILLHGGGWKTLQEEAVAPEVFASSLREVCSLEHIYDYYGMAEQTGSIFLQCEHGHYHCSNFSQIFVRDPYDFSLSKKGAPGILQVLSLLPRSYPGNSLLTEDEAVFLGEDDCPCGRKGKYFQILGRLKDAELRGCSDTYAETHR